MIKVYTTLTCSYCKMVKKYLQMKNVPYEEIDVTDDPATRQRLIDATGMMSVPVTQLGDEYIVGWQPGAFNKMISL